MAPSAPNDMIYFAQYHPCASYADGNGVTLLIVSHGTINVKAADAPTYANTMNDIDINNDSGISLQ